MKLGEQITLKINFTRSYGKIKDIDGVYTVIGVSYGMPHCFNKDSWSPGFNSFEYGELQQGRPDIVKVGSIFVPDASYLDEPVVENMEYDNKIVSWRLASYDREAMKKTDIPGFEGTFDNLNELTIRS